MSKKCEFDVMMTKIVTINVDHVAKFQRLLRLFLSHSVNFSEHKLQYHICVISVRLWLAIWWYFKWLTIYDIVNYLWRWEMTNLYGKEFICAFNSLIIIKNGNSKFIVALKIWTQPTNKYSQEGKKYYYFLEKIKVT